MQKRQPESKSKISKSNIQDETHTKLSRPQRLKKDRNSELKGVQSQTEVQKLKQNPKQQRKLKKSKKKSRILKSNSKLLKKEANSDQNIESKPRSKKQKRQNTFLVTTKINSNRREYELRGVFRLFNRRINSQKFFIEQTYTGNCLDSDCYQILLGVEGNMVQNNRTTNAFIPYRDLILNSFNIPENMEDQITNSKELYQFLFDNKSSIQVCSSFSNLKAITYLKIGPNSKFKEPIFISLQYPKDIITGKDSPRIGFATFKPDVPKKILGQILRSEDLRKLFYGKALKIQNQEKKSLDRWMNHVQRMEMKTLYISNGAQQLINKPLVLGKLKILIVYDLQSLECLQYLEFNSLQAILIGFKQTLNLRSLRKLHINPEAIKNQDSSLNFHYPSVIQIRSHRPEDPLTEYTFTNLSNLTELPFATNFSQHPTQNIVNYLRRFDQFMPSFLFAKMNASITNKRNQCKNQNYNGLPVNSTDYTFFSRYRSIFSKDLVHLADEVV